MGGRRLVRGPGRLGGMEHTSHSSRCLRGCRRRQGCQQSHRFRDRRRQNPRASAAAAAVAAAAREWLVGAAPVAAVGALGRSSSATRRAVVHPKPTFGRGRSRTTTADVETQFDEKFRTVRLLAPSASPRDRSNEARRARVAAVRRGRRRLGGWWLPSCAAAFRVEERFLVPPASVQRGGGAASSPLWHPERPESATTEER